MIPYDQNRGSGQWIKLGWYSRLPLSHGLAILHRLTIPPLRGRDPAIIHQDVDFPIQELRRFVDFLADLVGIAEIADGIVEFLGIEVLFQVDFGRVLELCFVDVEDEDFVASLYRRSMSGFDISHT